MSLDGGATLAVDGGHLLMRGLHGAGLGSAPDWPDRLPGVVAAMLRGLVTRHRPGRLVVALDAPAPTWRHELYPAYKAGRAETSPTTADLTAAMGPHWEAWGVPRVMVAAHEADDVLATLALDAVTAGERLDIVSGDEDLLQCVEPGVRVLWPAGRTEGGAGEDVYDTAAVRRRTGVEPHQVACWKALAGCPGDNIPKVGMAQLCKDGRERTYGLTRARAAELLRAGGDLEGVYARRAALATPRELEWLWKCEAAAFAMRELTRLRWNAPVPRVAWGGGGYAWPA